MIDSKVFEDIAKQMSQLLPSSLRNVQEDMQDKCRGILQGAFAKLDLVTREEFDVQCQVLARTRAKVEALEKQLAEIEKGIAGK